VLVLLGVAALALRRRRCGVEWQEEGI